MLATQWCLRAIVIHWISDAVRYMPQVDMCYAVSWKPCKQTILIRSTMEPELTTLDTTTVEAEWLRELLMDLLVVENLYQLFL
jgi:hypothetical protein